MSNIKYLIGSLLILIASSCITNEIDSKQLVEIYVEKTDTLQRDFIISVYNMDGQYVDSKIAEKGDTSVTFLLYPATYQYTVVGNLDKIAINEDSYMNLHEEWEIGNKVLSKYDAIKEAVEPVFYNRDGFTLEWDNSKSIKTETQLFSSLLEIEVLNTNIDTMPLFVYGLGTQMVNSEAMQDNVTETVYFDAGTKKIRANSKSLVYKKWIFPSIDAIALNFKIEDYMRKYE
ncbi:MAG: hypothetical protein ACRC26_10195, partial [Bacteroidales bacterium]